MAENSKTHSIKLAAKKYDCILILLAVLFLTGCSFEGLRPSPTATITLPTHTPPPTPIPVEGPLGSPDNPIMIAHIVSQNPFAAQEAGQAMVEFLAENSGLVITYRVFEDAREAFDLLRQEKIDFIWLQPLTYLAAYERDLVTPMYVSNHFGLFKYGTQFLANTSSGFIQYFDPVTNRNTTTEDIALTQFEGRRPCWTDPSSLSGTIVPYGLLARNGIQFLPPAYTQSHSSIVRALYIRGICDFGATFSYSGDPRTSSQVINDLSDAMEQVIIIWRSDPVIPSLSFHASTAVPDSIVEQMTAAMFNLSISENGNSILTAALDYDVQGLIAVDDDYFADIRDLVQAARIVPFQHLGY